VEDNKLQLAKQIYKTLCEAIEAREWSFNKDEERLAVYFEVNGEDIPIKLILIVDAERQLIRLLSPLPFDVAEDKRMDMAIAVCAANYGISDGGFDYDISEGSILFRLTSSFRNSVIGEGLLQYMLSCACVLVDKCNDQFLAINKGVMDISQFLSKDK